VTGPEDVLLLPPQDSNNVPPTLAASATLPVSARKRLRVIEATMVSTPLCGRLFRNEAAASLLLHVNYSLKAAKGFGVTENMPVYRLISY
jgi:hypothetical protein